jgi:hypothetical protein
MLFFVGSTDAQLKEKFKLDKDAKERLIRAGYSATYFPVEQRWMAFDANHKPVSDFHDDLFSLAKAVLQTNVTHITKEG